MKRAEQVDPIAESIWKFVRGDMSPTDFAQWACTDDTLEKQLGDLLYLDVISADYSSKDAVYGIKKSLKAFAQSAANVGCGCMALADLADIHMGTDIEDVLGRFEERARRGATKWWLSADQCSVCEQWWLVANESRINMANSAFD
jgi:NTP pyrophosphatase (non-canonical NTP hydrolase)